MLIFLGEGSCGGSRLEIVRGGQMSGNKGQKRSLLTVIELGDICARACLTIDTVVYSTHPPRCGPPSLSREG